jgi:hypothetical protein
MPFRPKRKRPIWNHELDYWLREKVRQQIIEEIRAKADSFTITKNRCSGCDQRIWEAHQGEIIHRGCHCMTLMLPPGHRLYRFDDLAWAEVVRAGGVMLEAQQSACVRTLTRLHPTVREDPFSVIKPALTSRPHSLGFDCPACEHQVKAAYPQPELTGFAFRFTACGCTGMSELAEIAEPDSERWEAIVSEASKLAPGVVKVGTRRMDEGPTAGGPN